MFPRSSFIYLHPPDQQRGEVYAHFILCSPDVNLNTGFIVQLPGHATRAVRRSSHHMDSPCQCVAQHFFNLVNCKSLTSTRPKLPIPHTSASWISFRWPPYLTDRLANGRIAQHLLRLRLNTWHFKAKNGYIPAIGEPKKISDSG